MTLEAIYQLLCSDHIQAQGIVDTLDEPLLLLDQNLCVIKANPAFLQTFQVESDHTLGISLFALGNGQWDIPELQKLLGEVIPKAQAVVGFEVTHEFPSIGRRTMLVSARRLIQSDGNGTSLLVVFKDITDARKTSDDNDLLLAESRHRMKNILSVVHAIAYQTKVKGRSAKEYRDVLLDRLDAFLGGSDLIAESGDGVVNLPALVDDALHSVNSDQIRVELCPSVQIDRGHVRPLRTILHELMTNALKYGALSSPDGVVRLRLSKTGEDNETILTLDWQEERGPPVTPPNGLGFGVNMIKNSARNCGGTSELCFDPDGLHVQVSIPACRRET